jgi:hypothetical protein
MRVRFPPDLIDMFVVAEPDGNSGAFFCYRVIYDNAAFNELRPFGFGLVFGLRKEATGRMGGAIQRRNR